MSEIEYLARKKKMIKPWLCIIFHFLFINWTFIHKLMMMMMDDHELFSSMAD